MVVVAAHWLHWRWFQLRNCSGHFCGSVIVMEMFAAVKSVSLTCVVLLSVQGRWGV